MDVRTRFPGFVSIGLLALLAGCGGGGGGGGGSGSSGPDTTPAPFSFPAQNDTARSAAVASDPIVVSGIDTSVPVSITGGEYSIDSGPFTSAAGTVSNGQSIRVRATTSQQFSTPITVTLTIGGISASFTVTTLAADTTPDALQFQRQGNVTRDAWVTSNNATISGINTPAPISIENGEYAIDGGTFTTAAGTVSEGQTVAVRAKASSTYSKVTRARVTVGSLTSEFEVTSELPNYVPDNIVYDGQDIVYLQSNANKQVYRWSLAEERYLDAYAIGLNALTPSKITYSNAHKRLYLGYSSGAISYIDATATTGTEVAFANTMLGVEGLVAVGNYVLAQDYSGSWAMHYIFDVGGAVTDKKDWNYYSSEYAWDPTTSRVYFFRDGFSPNDLHYEVIDQTTGKITIAGETPYHGAYNIVRPIRVSVNGQSVLLGSGDIYNQAGLTWAASLGSQVTDARWFTDGSIVALTTTNSQATLRRLSTTLTNNLEQVTYTGQGLRVVGSDTKMAVVLINSSTVQFRIYVPNNDSDGDGVSNTQDAFPLDAAASVDSDHDGYPDSWNAGKSQSDSTTGLTLDAYPQDSACYLLAHGDGVHCNFAATLPNYVPDQVIQDGDTVYLLSIANKRVYRWSIAAGSYLNPYTVGLNQGFTTLVPTKMAYSSTHKRLYLGYSSGAIQYIDVTSNGGEVPFANTAMAVGGLASVGNYVLAQDESGAWATHYIFNAAGALTDQKEWNYYSGEYAWDQGASRVYFFRDDTSPNDLQFEVIDQNTGKITSAGETPYHGTYYILPPIRLSTNGQYVLLGSGDIYNRPDLTWAGTTGSPVKDARWLADGSVVTLSTSGNQTTLRRLGATTLANIDQATYTGQALRVVGFDTKMVVLVINNSTVQFQSYVPNPDSDGDGISNTLDAFPLDAAASVDTDHDGYPDSWNAGKSQSDSTTGLSLDAYPQDAECYLLAHGDGVNCNYAATMPNYMPDQVTDDGSTVYLLSSANKRVYRWSIAASKYLKPYGVGITQGFSTLAPAKIAYVSSHHRLYVGYGNGTIRYIDVTGSASEMPFASTSANVSGLAAVGNYLFAQDNSQYGAFYLFNAGGATADQISATYSYSREYTWDPVTSRIYYFRDNISPNDLLYTGVNVATGKFTAGDETPYHGAYNIQPPIRVSANGQRVLLGSGDIYNQSGLTWSGSLGTQVADARWFADGSLVTLITASNQTTLRHLSSALLSTEQLTYTGQALRVVGTDAKMVVVTTNNSTVQFNVYVPNNDTDNDGVINTLDAFPLDPAASVDTDHDGHPDSWNAGKSQSDSTTGLTLDAYPQDSACYLLAHGDGVNCNYASTVPNYVPDQVINDGDTVYLLSAANKRVYRWSTATGTYMNPYVVGIDQGFGTLTPSKMAYSSAHHRLYFAYNTGAIRYLDTTVTNGTETAFANTAMAARGIAAVGNYVLAQDDSGAWATHYIFNVSGTITDQKEWNYYSREYAWDPVHSRVYFMRDDTSPNDLHFEVIDQTNGHITSVGETPYHGDYMIQPPIRVSTDGEFVLLGGDLYEQPNLVFAGSVGTVTDAQWKDNLLVALDPTDRVLIEDADSHAVLASYQYTGQPIRIVFGQTDAYLVHVLNNTTTFLKLPFNDQDGDTMPKWWEQVYGLSDSNAADAVLDADGDGVNNATEYANHSNPLLADTDGDGLTDSQEIGTYSTNPGKADGDGDGLNDKDEVVTYSTDPWDTDTDNDGYSDLDEVLYGGDPNDPSGLPQPLINYSQSFESSPLSAAWSTPKSSATPWTIDTTTSRTGSASLKSGTAIRPKTSTMRFHGVFSAGQMRFYAKSNGASCCTTMIVLVDGLSAVYSSSPATDWTLYSFPVTAGIHDIEWQFQDFYGPASAVWVDDVTFGP